MRLPTHVGFWIHAETEQARRDAVPRLLGLGLSVEQVAEALMSVEEVRGL